MKNIDTYDYLLLDKHGTSAVTVQMTKECFNLTNEQFGELSDKIINPLRNFLSDYGKKK